MAGERFIYALADWTVERRGKQRGRVTRLWG